tara:strand:- start:612 stop:1556 length:945 start_codon:yes stop_codon:yes gene_type:complete
MIENRKKVYDNLKGYRTDLTHPGYVYTYDIDEKHYANLKNSSLKYLNESLSIYYGKNFNINDREQLGENIDNILSMPNITPGGKFLPKKETAHHLNDLQKYFLEYLDDINLLNEIDELQSINIWIKSYKQNKKHSQRKKYTGKIHSDAWVGHYGDCILWLSPLMGKDNTMEILRPINPASNFLQVAETFEEGQKRYSDTESICKVKLKTMAVMDHAALHRTYYKENSLPRITVSCGASLKNKNSLMGVSNKSFRKEFDGSYFKILDLNGIATGDSCFAVQETLKDCELKFKDPSRDYEVLPNNGIFIKNNRRKR